MVGRGRVFDTAQESRKLGSARTRPLRRASTTPLLRASCLAWKTYAALGVLDDASEALLLISMLEENSSSDTSQSQHDLIVWSIAAHAATHTLHVCVCYARFAQGASLTHAVAFLTQADASLVSDLLTISLAKVLCPAA